MTALQVAWLLCVVPLPSCWRGDGSPASDYDTIVVLELVLELASHAVVEPALARREPEAGQLDGKAARCLEAGSDRHA